jgi:hypothetical protein
MSVHSSGANAVNHRNAALGGRVGRKAFDQMAGELKA